MKTGILFLLSVSGLLLAPMASAQPPRFEDYPVAKIYQGEPAGVDYAGFPELRTFHHEVESRRGDVVNYAGEYATPAWGCGTSCVTFVIVSLRTGRLVDQVVTCGDFNVRPDSRLLVINPEAEEDVYPEGCKTEYYVLDAGQLRPLKKQAENG